MSDKAAHPSAMQFNCPECAAELNATSKHYGKRSSCPRCGSQVVVPQLANEPSPGEIASPEAHQSGSDRPKLGWVALAWTTLSCALLVVVISIAIYALGDWTKEDHREHATHQEIAKRSVQDSSSDPDASLPENRSAPVPDASTGEAQLAMHVDERAYEVTLEVDYPSGEQFAWRGTTVVAQALHADAILMTGVAIPNRWVIVPLKAVENAKQIWVRHAGITYEAQVRSRLTKLDFATLQINRSEKFSAPFCDRENELEWNSKNMTLVYRDESNHVQTLDGFNVTAKKDGIEYWINGERIPNQAMGGVVLHKSGRIAGLVKRRSANDVLLMPWSRIGLGWGEKGGKGLFDYLSPMLEGNAADLASFHGNSLVQVIIVPETVQSSDQATKYLFETRITADGVPPAIRFADWTLPSSVRCNSAQEFELVDTPRSGIQLRSIHQENAQQWQAPPQLPFLIGSSGRLAIEAIPDPKAETWSSSRKVSVKLHEECTIRDKGKQSKAFEMGFIQEEDWQVVERGSNTLTLTRKVRLYPFAIDRRQHFEIDGEEQLTVSLRDSFVIEREYRGRFIQTDDQASKSEAAIHFVMKRLRDSQAANAPAYWRTSQ